MKMKEDNMEKIGLMLDELSQDISVPRNIRRKAKEAKEILLKGEESMNVRVASAISMLEELTNDPNTPIHGRTAIWNILSALESLLAKE